MYGDVFDWLARRTRRGARFDLVILDPPGFSRTKSRSFSAARDTGALAGLAARVAAANGLLRLPYPRRTTRELGFLQVAGLGYNSMKLA